MFERHSAIKHNTLAVWKHGVTPLAVVLAKVPKFYVICIDLRIFARPPPFELSSFSRLSLGEESPVISVSFLFDTFSVEKKTFSGIYEYASQSGSRSWDSVFHTFDNFLLVFCALLNDVK